jgi:hypothetical protein
MKGDFTRDTFDPRKHFSRVLMQQGRVQLDADWNEQAAILLHYLQALAADLIGPHGCPGGVGFAFGGGTGFDFTFGNGHYYVDGILCENEGYFEPQSNAIKTWTYLSQPYYPLDKEKDKLRPGTWLVYLDVWERHLTYVEVEDAQGSVISIREVALGGPDTDTATRAQVVWQVKVWAYSGSCPAPRTWTELVNAWQSSNRGQLKARAIKPESADAANPCITPPESRYRGAENQLYRVEIHKRGTVAEGATFKWSRENGSVIFPIVGVEDKGYLVTGLGCDPRSCLEPGDWVEFVNDDITLQNIANPLLQVDSIDPDTNTVKFPVLPSVPDKAKHPFLRRWDQKDTDNYTPNENGVTIVEGDNYIELEDGVQIQFTKPASGQPASEYRTGDYWLIPARTATGDVEWPGPKNAPEAQEPHGITHHYAPLWIILVEPAGAVTADPNMDCRRKFSITVA